MTKTELFKLLKDAPDNAEIYIEADHGQTPEPAFKVSFSKDDDLYEPEEISFKTTNTPIHATAILIY